MTNIKIAKEIMGELQCISFEESIDFWKPNSINNCQDILYSTETLEKASMDNVMGRNNWHLIWLNGLSLFEQYEKIGSNKNKQPCFYEYRPFFIEERCCWAYASSKPGYYLINLSPKISNLTSEETENEIKKSGDEHIWCEEQIFSEINFTLFISRRIRPAEHWYHRGRNIFDGKSVILGNFGCNGFDVNGFSYVHAAKDVKTCVYKKQQ